MVQIQAMDGAIAAHMTQQEYGSMDPALLQAAAMQIGNAEAFRLQVRQPLRWDSAFPVFLAFLQIVFDSLHPIRHPLKWLHPALKTLGKLR